MNGGTAVLGMVRLAENADATGVMTLNAGSLTATEITTGNTGASQRELDFNGGTLVAGADNANFIHDLSAANVKSGGALFDTAGHTVSANQALLGTTADGGLTKNGNGTLYLNGANTYTNTTMVKAGMLGGTGSILSPVTVSAGATMGAGTDSIGTLAISNTLTFAANSRAFFKLAPGASDQIVGLTGVSYNGALVVSNTTGASLAGSAFKLFNSASAGTGNFTSVTVLPAGTGVFNPATGELIIPGFHSITTSAGKLILTGAAGLPGAGYTLLTSTNVTLPVASWKTNTTGFLDGTGAFSNAIPINASELERFFRIRLP
jgi:autotransporter-associated beta strand protein